MSFSTKTLSSFAVVLLCTLALNVQAERLPNGLINVNPDPNGTPWIVGGTLPQTEEEIAEYEKLPKLNAGGRMRTFAAPRATRPAVDNSTNLHFPPVFLQTGGSCAQASGIGYIFTYEMARIRQLDASLNQNRYPEHFTWNFLNDGIGSGSRVVDGWEIAQEIGVPSVATFGGMSTPSPHTQWMSGYDNYYEAMKNRSLTWYGANHSTASDIEAIKAWLDHRNAGEPVGGLVSFAVAFTGLDMRYTADNQPIIIRFGSDGGHAMTIVGYDDTIAYDINGDGQITTDIDINGDGVVDIQDSEVGAFRIANTWGTSWGDGGFAWVPYSTFAMPSRESGIYTSNMRMLDVQEHYTPQYTLKASVAFPRRSAIKISVGVATDPSATEPEAIESYSAFSFKGGQHPMKGEGEDPLEFGLDLTALFNQVGAEEVKKVFLIVENSAGEYFSEAKIHSVSVLDYTGTTPVEIEGDRNIAISYAQLGSGYATYAKVLLDKVCIECDEFTATLAQHEAAGRAYTKSTTSWWLTTKTWYAVGSDEVLGTNSLTSVTLYEEATGVFRVGNCPSADTTPPVITLKGDKTTYLVLNNTFVDPGVTAMDDRDGDISDQVVVTGSVSTQMEGTYHLFYNVSDAAGNAAATVVRTVVVEPTLTCQEFTSMLSSHEVAGRAYTQSSSSWWTTTKTWYAVGSNDLLGTVGTVSKTLREMPIGSGHFEEGQCPEGPKPPQIASVKSVVDGDTVTISGVAVDPDDDVNAVNLYFPGGGLSCNIENPIGTAGNIAYDCSDMSNWSFVVSELPDGVYDCEEGNSCLAVAAIDMTGLASEMTFLSFVIGESPVAPCFKALNTAHAQAGRAELMYTVLYYSIGGGDYLGMGTATTSLQEESAGVWKLVNSCP